MLTNFNNTEETLGHIRNIIDKKNKTNKPYDHLLLDESLKRIELLVSRNSTQNLAKLSKANSAASSLKKSTSNSLSRSSSASSLFLKHTQDTTNNYSSLTKLIYDLNNDCLRESFSASKENDFRQTTTTTSHSPNTTLTQKSLSSNEEDSTDTALYQARLKSIMVLNTEWTQLEIIELLNETSASFYSTHHTSTHTNTSSSTPKNEKTTPSSNTTLSSANVNSGGSGGGGFGFGITGNKSTGVVVKAITPGGSAFRVIFHNYT